METHHFWLSFQQDRDVLRAYIANFARRFGRSTQTKGVVSDL
jgi:hypothetical protein